MSCAMFVWTALLSLAVARPLVKPQIIGNPKVDLPAGSFRVHQLQLADKSTYLRLRGLQYAEHPVGELRWQPPQPVSDSGRHVIDARSFGADCINSPWYYRVVTDKLAAQSESCLFLNVWAPEANVTLPVMFWIHGGSFTSGGTTSYDGDAVMATKNEAVLVTSQFRLGALGFLAGPAVQRSSRDGSAGNFAQQDNRLALVWVQRNIAALRGDPKRVTIFGESSGGSMVAAHIVMPRSSGLFSGAIMQSGALDNYTAQSNATQNFRAIAMAAGCTETDDDLALVCLRKKPLRTLVGKSLIHAMANENVTGVFSPTVDGVELLDVPEVLAARGQVNPLRSVLLGANMNEGRFMMMFTNPVDGAPFVNESSFRKWMLAKVGSDHLETALSLYPAEAKGRLKGSWWKAAAKAYTDQQYTCPTARSARWLARSGKVDNSSVYVYELMYRAQGYGKMAKLLYQYWWCGLNVNCPARDTIMGVGHTADLALVWPKFSMKNATDALVSERMLGWWQNFAASGSPADSASDIPWPAYADAEDTLYVNAAPKTVRGNRAKFCAFWDALHPVPYSPASVHVV